ncbi:hypothetical protein EGW08_000236, partial [Elysia chlorotica]
TVEIGTTYLTPDKDDCPLFTRLYYPLKPGYYTPIFFLGGLYDIIGSGFYKTFLQNIAKHGYMVFGIDLIKPLLNDTAREEIEMETFRRRSLLESHLYRQEKYKEIIPNIFEQMQWLKSHVNNNTKTKADWDKLTLACHSASCTTTLNMVQTYPTFAAAAVFFDPVCLNAIYRKPVKSNTKALAYVSSKSYTFPSCCVPGLGYERVYELMTNSKVRMRVKNVGHCDLLEKLERILCNRTGVCHGGPETQVSEYQQFTAGMTHAFLRWTLYGEQDMRQYVTDQSLMPMKLDDLAYEIHPSQSVTTGDDMGVGMDDGMGDDIHFDPGTKRNMKRDPTAEERRLSLV